MHVQIVDDDKTGRTKQLLITADTFNDEIYLSEAAKVFLNGGDLVAEPTGSRRVRWRQLKEGKKKDGEF